MSNAHCSQLRSLCIKLVRARAFRAPCKERLRVARGLHLHRTSAQLRLIAGMQCSFDRFHSMMDVRTFQRSSGPCRQRPTAAPQMRTPLCSAAPLVRPPRTAHSAAPATLVPNKPKLSYVGITRAGQCTVSSLAAASATPHPRLHPATPRSWHIPHDASCIYPMQLTG